MRQQLNVYILFRSGSGKTHKNTSVVAGYTAEPEAEVEGQVQVSKVELELVATSQVVFLTKASSLKKNICHSFSQSIMY